MKRNADPNRGESAVPEAGLGSNRPRSIRQANNSERFLRKPTGQMLNSNVKPYFPSVPRAACDVRWLSDTFSRCESGEVGSNGLPWAVLNSGLEPFNVWAGTAFTASKSDESIFKTYLDRLE